MTNWAHFLQEAHEECCRLCPGLDRVGFMLDRPAQSLAAARWLFPDSEVRVTVPPSRPDQMQIRFQTPSLALSDWRSFKQFRLMFDLASTVTIRPRGDQLLIELGFHEVWLEDRPDSQPQT